MAVLLLIIIILASVLNSPQGLTSALDQHTDLLVRDSVARQISVNGAAAGETAPEAGAVLGQTGVGGAPLPSWLGPVPPVGENCAPPPESISRDGEEFSSVVRSRFTVQDISDEYFAVGGTRDVEARWGEGLPHIKAGYSWRGAKTRGAGRVKISSLWSQLKPM